MPKFGFPFLETFLLETKAKTPILLMTSDNELARVLFGAKYQVLAKPFSFETMLQMIRQLLAD
jgi:DNA-binding response OmpR family regulator